MREKCPSGYAIVEQGEAVKGMQGAFVFGVLVTEDRKEWQVVFECKGAGDAKTTRQ